LRCRRSSRSRCGGRPGTGATAAHRRIVAGQRLTPQKGSWRGVLIGGVLAVAVFNLSTAFAQLNTSTSRAAVLTFTMPMMSAVLSWLVMGERIGRRQVIALGLGMAGVLVLAWPVLVSLLEVHDARALKGLLFPLVAAFGWAAGTVYLQRWPVAGERMVFTAWQLLVGAACRAIGALAFGERPHGAVAHRSDRRAVCPHRARHRDGVLAVVHHERARQRNGLVDDHADGAGGRRTGRDGAGRRPAQRRRLVRIRAGSRGAALIVLKLEFTLAARAQ
jgi:multidrug transporter EmrE-like cation transporter